MRMVGHFLLAIVLCSLSVLYCEGTIRILLSAALTDAHFEFRKQQYIEAFEALNHYGYNDVYVIEAVRKNGPTFLDGYSTKVFYSTANNAHLKNKGINEARTLLEGTYHFKFAPNDMILKLTGRYQIVSDYFIELVRDNLDYDAIVKLKHNGDVWTLGFAMKCKYFQEMFEEMDYQSMERRWIDVEHMVALYIKNKVKAGNFKVLHVTKLDIKANLFGSSNWVSAPDQLIFF
jgi:hypothetical protein